ncbi:methylated-DNA--[protein]-cysteine S-methyltransferase [Limnohabitans sp.]|uniref:methylated-DNA--[protein]-cysteine S-methyltransferase n=1 Tax=Limnohabitans sp. TaxID=1907725 RepID=UPI00333F9AEA
MRAQPIAPLFQSHFSSPLGQMLLAANEQGLTGVWFVLGQQHMPDTSGWQTNHTHPTLQKATQQLAEYFSGQRHTFDLPLHSAWGTPFQRNVWRALQRISYGQTGTYGDIARNIGNPKAVRAVGAAIGQNPHTIVVPCHRVIGANGSLTGFAGGLDRKTFLLAHEAAHA